jgi:hypothetical protein
VTERHAAGPASQPWQCGPRVSEVGSIRGAAALLVLDQVAEVHALLTLQPLVHLGEVLRRQHQEAAADHSVREACAVLLDLHREVTFGVAEAADKHDVDRIPAEP